MREKEELKFGFCFNCDEDRILNDDNLCSECDKKLKDITAITHQLVAVEQKILRMYEEVRQLEKTKTDLKNQMFILKFNKKVEA